MVKVSGALSSQIMIIYHHCAIPDPLRAVSGPHGPRNGQIIRLSTKKWTVEAVPRPIKEL